MFIELGYSNLYELFLKNKELNILSKCKNTLFIFHFWIILIKKLKSK